MWRYEARNGGGKPSMAPYVAADPNRHASSKDPCDWCDFETAIATAKRHGFDGVSFALTPAVATTKPGTFTPTATTWIAAFDLDDCRNPKSGALALWAQGLIEEARSYVEITPSGTGLRIIGYGRADSAVHNKLKAPGGGSCEIYRQTPKFITVTGDALDGWNTDLANIDAAILGARTRIGKRIGDEAYAIEELVAELGAAFLCADLRITDVPRADHAQYLASWLAVLKADKKAIFTAASKASEAAAFLAALQGA
jgi:primase-polymerase (primpol)-like protein